MMTYGEPIKQIIKLRLKTSMLNSSLCDYSDAHILVSGTITIAGLGRDHTAKRVDEIENTVMFRTCGSFTDYISETNNTQIDNAKDIYVVMLICNFIE